MKKKKWIVSGIVIVAAAVIASSVYWMTQGVEVDTASVTKGDLTRYVKESGTIQPMNMVIVTAKNSATVQEIYFDPGDMVTAGDVLFFMDDGTGEAALDIKSMEAELSGVKAQYDLAKNSLDKNKILYEQGAISSDDYMQSVTAEKQLAAQMSSISYSIASYRKSAENLSGTIKATMNGMITDLFVKKGETVMPGSSMMEISDPQNYYIKVDLIAEDAEKIAVGNSAITENKELAYLDGQCRVSKIQPKAKETMSELGISQKRVTVELLPGAEKTIRVGNDVDVKIVSEQKNNVILVPKKAIFQKDRKQWVYTVAGSRAVLQEIETGLEGEDHTEVITGLSEGEIVVLSPGDAVGDGVRLKEK